MAELSVRHAVGATEPVRFAAGELATYLGRMAGQLLESRPARKPG